MELEKLEIVFDANMEKLQENIDKVWPSIEKTFQKIDKISKGTGDKVGHNLDFQKIAERQNIIFEKMEKNMSHHFSKMENMAKDTGEQTGRNIATGVSKGSKTINKSIDTMIKDMNSKMGQAKAQQEKLAFLKSQRQGSVRSGDDKKVVNYDTQIAQAQAAMNRYHSQAKDVARSMKKEFNAVPNSLNSIAFKMDSNEKQIERTRKKIAQMNREYKDQRLVSGGFTDKQSFEDTPRSNKTMDSILKQTEKMNKLIRDNDNLQNAYAETEDRAKILKNTMAQVNTELGKPSFKEAEKNTNKFKDVLSILNRTLKRSVSNMGSAAYNLARFSKKGNDSTSIFSRFGGVFNRTSNNIAHGSKSINKGLGGIQRSMKSLFSSLIVFGMMYKGIQVLSKGLWDSLKTNETFSSSLNQIKVNLLTAFYPIYNAVLPALNALMNGLAYATGQVAAFISHLFGTTYESSKQGAKGLYENIQAMNDTTKSIDGSGTSADKAKDKVKKLQRALMGFDEINKLSISVDEKEKTNDDPTKPAIDFSGAGNDYGVPAWANKVKGMFKDFFAPFKSAWAKHGKAVMDAWKYALNEVWQLVKAIGNSFMEVWTNGSGERLISNLLILLSDVLNIIGDIAKAFRIAWEENDRGTKLIQQIFDALNTWLEVLHLIAVSFREVWNNGTGIEVARNILDLFTNIFRIIETVGISFKNAWQDNGRGTAMIQAIFDALNAVLRLLVSITDSFDRAFSSGIGERIIANILEITTNLFNIVANLANQFNKAWKEADIGTKIIQGILELINIVLDTINDMTLATAEWAKSLDFTPLLQSIKKLLDSMQPLTKHIGQGLSWFYENVLLKLAKFTIEDIIPSFLDLLSGALDLLDGIIIAFKPAFKFFWDNVLEPLAKWTGGVIVKVMEGLGKALSSIGDWLKVHNKGFSDFVIAVVTFSGVAKLISLITTGFSILSGVLGTVSSIIAGSGGVTAALSGLISILGGPITVAIGIAVTAGVLLWKNWDKIKEMATKLGKWISKKWLGIKDSTSEAWGKVSKWTSDHWDKTKESIKSAAKKSAEYISNKWDSIKTITSEVWGKVSKWTSEKWTSTKKYISDSTKESGAAVSRRWKAIKDSTSEAWGKVSKWTSNKWKDTKDSIFRAAGTSEEEVNRKWKKVKKATESFFGDALDITKNNFGGIMKEIEESSNGSESKATTAWKVLKKHTASAFRDIKKSAVENFGFIIDKAAGLGKEIGDAFKKGTKALKDGAKNMFKGAVDGVAHGVNKVFEGTRFVLKAVGATGVADGIKDWVPKYATGTGNHPGGLAWVGDGGMNELISYGGNMFLSPATDTLVNLPRGAEVLSGPKTQAFFDGDVPAYAKGSGGWLDKIIGGAKGFGKSAFNKVKDWSNDIWDWVADKASIGSLLGHKIGKSLDKYAGFTGHLVQGVTKKGIESAKDFIFNKATENGSSFDGAVSKDFGMGSYKYLADIAKKAIKRFDMTGGVTSGFRPGDVYWHGKRQAIDIAYPASMNGTKKYMDPANWVFENFPKQVGYVITQGKVRDRSGMSGQVANSKWVPWPDNDHYDHLHINGLLGAKDVGKGDTGIDGKKDKHGNPPGSGVDRWKPYVNKAFVATGVIKTQERFKKFMTQIQTESNGDPGVTQNGYHDENSGGNEARGLMQIVPTTWNDIIARYFQGAKMDPYNGYDSIKAALMYIDNYVNSSIGYYKPGDYWRWIGRGQGYENGGIVQNEGMYRLAEGNKKEMIIPLEKTSRARNLIEQAIEYLGIGDEFASIEMPNVFDDTTTQKFVSNNHQVNDINDGGINQMTSTLANAIMMAIGDNNQSNQPVSVTLEADSRQLAEVVIKEINKMTKRNGIIPIAF